jgi:hypothetical protein
VQPVFVLGLLTKAIDLLLVCMMSA